VLEPTLLTDYREFVEKFHDLRLNHLHKRTKGYSFAA